MQKASNRFKRLDISDARELVGYAPEGDAAQLLPQIKDLKLNETLQSHGAIVDRQKSGLRDELEQLKNVWL